MATGETMRFVATAVAYQHEAEVETKYLVAAEHVDGSGRTLEVQRSLVEDDDYERSLGLDGYCVVLDGGPTAYRSVERWVAAGTTVVLHLTSEGADALGVRSIALEADTGTAALIRSVLRHLIDGGPDVDDFTLTTP